MKDFLWEALEDEARKYPGLVYRKGGGSKHPRIEVEFDGQSRFFPYAGTLTDGPAVLNYVRDFRKIILQTGARRAEGEELRAIENNRHAEYLAKTVNGAVTHTQRIAPKNPHKAPKVDIVATLKKEAMAAKNVRPLYPHKERRMTMKEKAKEITLLRERAKTRGALAMQQGLQEALTAAEAKPATAPKVAAAKPVRAPLKALPHKDFSALAVHWRLLDADGGVLGVRQRYQELLEEPEWPVGVAVIDFVDPELDGDPSEDEYVENI